MRGALNRILPVLVVNRAIEHGDLRRIDEAAAMLAETQSDPESQLMLAVVALARRVQQGDRAGFAEELARLHRPKGVAG